MYSYRYTIRNRFYYLKTVACKVTTEFFITVFLFLCCSPIVEAQSTNLKNNIKGLTAASDSFHHNRPEDKPYLQFDKPNYAIGDTIWFKGYLLDAAYLMPSVKSGILHIDIANDSNKVIKRFILAVQNGLTWGNISLNEKEFFTGTYTIYAYTNWMRNFGEDCFYAKQLYITSSNEHGWLISTQITPPINNKDEIDARLKFTKPDKTPIAANPLKLQVIAGNKNLYKQKLSTDLNGALNVHFTIPEKLTHVAIIAEDEKTSRKAVIPVNLNLVQNADVQFLPEGGNLVAGLPAHIGFKAIGEDGKGIDISGIVVNQNQKQVAAFRSQHLGMGSFDLGTNDGETYTAKVTLSGGTIKTYQLPAIKKSGTVLQVKNLAESDSVQVIVASNDHIESQNSYFLIARARGIVCYAAVINLRDSNMIRGKIAKKLFPTGIAHFTLLNTNKQALNERMVFVDHQDNLTIQFSTDKPSYTKRDSIALHLKITDYAGNPVSGNFSLAVTDNNQVKANNPNSDNILSRLLLTSDLKGYIEEPGFYVSGNTKDRAIALDNLLLAQGWVNYNWQQVLNPQNIQYQPEQEAIVKGHVFNVFNKPVRGTKVQLFSKSPFLMMDTVTSEEGEFVFRHLPAVDTPVFVIKAVNRNGKSFNVGIRAEETPPPVFTKIAASALLPWYVNSDTTLLNYTRNEGVRQQQPFLPQPGMHELKGVNIIARKTIKGSQNLNGTGNADVIIDEKELEKAGKKTFLQLLEEKVKGFRVGSYKLVNWYFVRDKWAVIIVDGVRLSDFYEPNIDYIPLLLNLKNYLNIHSAEDIKGIEVNFSGKYSSNYIGRFMVPGSWEPVKLDYVFIEITTRSGQGPFIDNTPGMYLYKPLALSWPKQFYKPKYAVKEATGYTQDLRSTITWEPNIVTDRNGMATVSFYTADLPSTYTLIINGTDLNGHLGYKAGEINVKKSKDKGQ